jgi:zinc D-Ala-D-Ala dipeptidase
MPPTAKSPTAQSAAPNPIPGSTPGSALIDIRSIAPSIVLDIRYATENNFLGKPVYPQARALLRAPIAQQLAKVQADLRQQGLGLKVFDAYRPLSVQKQMWQILPDPTYVADPAEGSRHNRGAAVDVTLVNAQGQELEMPSAFDEFSEKAHRNYTGGSATARHNRQMLAQAMARHGFVGLPSEWWHFDGPSWQNYEVLDIPFSQLRTDLN